MQKVTLIAKTDFLLHEDDELLADYAAGICYKSPMKQTKERIKNCIDRGHESIIEHLSATFLIEDISHACSHQIVRHRLSSYSQESQRRVEVDEEDSPIIPESIAYEPKSMAPDDEAVALYQAALINARCAYVDLIGLGIPKQDARYVLPNATKTRLVMTSNLRQWRHFIELRADKASQWEIRGVALDILFDLYELYPTIFGDLFEKFLGEQ